MKSIEPKIVFAKWPSFTHSSVQKFYMLVIVIMQHWPFWSVSAVFVDKGRKWTEKAEKKTSNQNGVLWKWTEKKLDGRNRNEMECFKNNLKFLNFQTLFFGLN